MTTVTCVGIAVADTVLEVPVVPPPGTKSFATSMSEQSGGPAATAAVTVARLGGVARFVGRVGDDERGHRLISELRRQGVDTTGVETLGGARTSTSIVLVTPDGERTIINLTDPRLVTGAAPEVTGDVILVDARWIDAARSVLESARDRRITTVMDLDRSPDPEWSANLARAATYPIASLPAAVELTGITEPAKCLVRLSVLLGRSGTVLTDGPRGAWYLANGVPSHVPAPAVDAVETLGAGDVFHGAFAWAVGAGMDLEQALRAASRVAADRCTRRGGWNAIPREVPWN